MSKYRVNHEDMLLPRMEELYGMMLESSLSSIDSVTENSREVDLDIFNKSCTISSHNKN